MHPSARPPDQELLGKALNALGRRERTEAEMRAWLLAREEDEQTVEDLMVWLGENLALDDDRFATEFARDKRELSGWGAERIERVLREKGVEPALARAAATAGGQSEVDRAVEVLRERGSRVDNDRERARALGLLARRGYSADDAYAAIRRLEREAA